MTREEHWARVARAMAAEQDLARDSKAFTGGAEKVAAEAMRMAKAKTATATELAAFAEALLKGKP